MVEHKNHAVSMAGESADAIVEGGHQIVESFKQNIGQDGAFDVAPQAFDQIQAR